MRMRNSFGLRRFRGQLQVFPYLPGILSGYPNRVALYETHKISDLFKGKEDGQR